MITVKARIRSLLLATVIGAAGVACTTPASALSPDAPADAPRPEPVAELAVPDQETTVLDVPPGAGSALAVSSLLFRKAPVVVVAAEGDAEGTATAAEVAKEVGGP